MAKQTDAKLLKTMGAKATKKVVASTIKVDVLSISGVETIEAPKGISIAELKKILGTTDATFADKKTQRQLTDTDVLNDNCELYRVTIKANA